MREVFQHQLHEVQARLVDISELVANAITQAEKAFNSPDVRLAETVIATDPRIDEMAVKLDENAIDILALQQPVARDLRIVVSALRISASLERMGDIAQHIAQLARFRYPENVAPKALRDTFSQMGELDRQIANKLTELLRTEDPDIAIAMRDIDDAIDELHVGVFDTVLSETWQGEAMATVDVTLASRYFERFADHAVSIAKKVQYLQTGAWAGAEA